MSPNILVFGSSGQVARALAAAAPSDVSLDFAGHDRCDLLTEDPGALIGRLKPSAVINAAAYTAVDKAESDLHAAMRLNRDAPASMARACANVGVPFVHISTDYVFNGTKPTPYLESDPVDPLGVYARSKAEGEAVVIGVGGAWSIFRTSWVVSRTGANFINTMRRLSAERDVVRVVDDQYGRLTLASDIAAVCLLAVRRSLAGDATLQGLFHVAGADDATWADIADRVFQNTAHQTGRRPTLERIRTAEYPTPASRPANSRLDTSKLQKAAGWAPREWRETVDICIG